MNHLPDEQADDVVSYDPSPASIDDSCVDLQAEAAPADLTAEEAGYWRHFYALMEAGKDPTVEWLRRVQAAQKGGCCDGAPLD